MRILVTGANGFLGRALCQTLTDAGHTVRAAVRTPTPELANVEQVITGDIGSDTNWSAALRGVDAVAHLAARVHVMREVAVAHAPLQAFRRINVAATEKLARSASDHGVRRVVFVSSIKVNGERSPPGRAFSEADTPAPREPYGVSKWEAEKTLQRVASETGLESVILRPPLVYGPRVKANFLNLMKLVARGVPLPFGGIDNCRSLIFLRNLTDALHQCLAHPQAANQLFMVSDGEDLSTPELIRRLGLALHRPAHLLRVPEGLLRLIARVAGQTNALARLTESLTVDASRIRHRLGWTPPHSVAQGLQETAEWFLHEPRRLRTC